MRVQNDGRWTKHVFDMSKDAAKGSRFLEWCNKYFTAADISTIYTASIQPKLQYNSSGWAEASKLCLEVVDRTQRNEGVSRSLDTLELSAYTFYFLSVVHKIKHLLQ